MQTKLRRTSGKKSFSDENFYKYASVRYHRSSGVVGLMGFFDFWKRLKTKEKVSIPPLKGQDWEFYSYLDEEEKPIFVYFDFGLAKENHHIGYGVCERVIVLLGSQYSSEEGLPLETAQTYLSQLENNLLEGLTKQKVQCLYVAKLIYRGVIEFVFQVENISAFESELSTFRANHQEENIELQGKEGWTFFDRKIKPPYSIWLQIQDRRQIQDLQKLQTGLQQSYLFTYTFYGYNKAIKSLAQELLQEPRLQDIKIEEKGKVATLVLNRVGSIAAEEVTLFTSMMEEASYDFDVEYRGWQAKIFATDINLSEV